MKLDFSSNGFPVDALLSWKTQSFLSDRYDDRTLKHGRIFPIPGTRGCWMSFCMLLCSINSRVWREIPFLSFSHNRVNKPNQDRVLVHYDELTKSLIVGVFDGHGKEGHLVAHVRTFMEVLLMSSLSGRNFWTVWSRSTFSRLMLCPLFTMLSNELKRKLLKVGDDMASLYSYPSSNASRLSR